jgi:hypothetical protein
LGEDSPCIYNRTSIYNREDKTWSEGLAILFLKYTPKTPIPLKVHMHKFLSISKIACIFIIKCLSIKKKKCPNPIIISSNMGVGNLVKEMLPSAPYINPAFAFQAAK